jgi:hypothetical protein
MGDPEENPAAEPAALEGGLDTTGKVTPAMAKQMFPATPLAPIAQNLPFVLQALREAGLGDKPMVLMALATIRAETEGFVPISEFRSKFNTAHTPFDLYEPGTSAGTKLGNTQPGDGPRFKGRGFVQLTGRDNYTRIGAQLGVDLVDSPDEANAPLLAGKILAQFLHNNEGKIRNALDADDLPQARKLVNGGSHGLPIFTDAYRIGQRVIPAA